MGFAQEMKDFAAGFKVGTDFHDSRQRRKASQNQIDRTRRPKDDDLDSVADPFTGIQPSGVETRSGGGGGGVNSAFGKQAYDYYRSKGLPHHKAAAIAGNLEVESGGAEDVLTGKRRGDNGTAAYAAQWRGERLSNLESFAKSRGEQIPGLTTQFDFVLEEGNPESPYAEPGAVKAFSLMDQTDDVGEATNYFMTHFERPADDPKINHIDRRRTIASSFGDSGGAATTQTAAASKGTGAIPSDEEEDSDEEILYGDEGGEEDEFLSERSSPEAGVEVEEVDQALLGGGPAPQVPQYVQPAMFAAEGGVIPEFAAGGQVDKYNAGRAYTQAVPQQVGGAGFTPRRVGSAPTTPSTYQPTNAQAKFREYQANRAAQEAAAKAAAEKAARDKAAADAAAAAAQNTNRPRVPALVPGALPPQNFEEYQQQALQQQSALQYAPQNSMGSDSPGWWARKTRAKKQLSQMKTPQGQQVLQNRWDALGSTDPAAAKKARIQQMGLSTFGYAPGFGFEEGGVIPEPGQHFARGGKVKGGVPRYQSRRAVDAGLTDDDPYWTESKPRKTKAATRAKAKSNEKGDKEKPAKGRSARNSASEDRSENAPTPTPRPQREVAEDRSTRDRSVQPMPERLEGTPPDLEGGAIPEGPAVAGQEPHWSETFRPTQWLGDMLTPSAEASPGMGGVPAANRMAEPNPERFGPPSNPSSIVRPDPSQVEPPQYPPNVPSQEQFGPGDPKEPLVLFNGKMVPLSQVQYGAAAPWLGYARGGVIPDEEDVEPIYNSRRAEEAGLTNRSPARAPAPVEEAPEPEQEEKPSRAPTPLLLEHVNGALQGGLRFIQNHFGLGGDGGAMPTPEGGQQANNGAMRLAKGEGATTPEELRGIDDAIDPDRQMPEGDRQMTRLAKTTQWYLEQGRGKEAEAAAASLIQYGAQRFGRLGSLAGAAYRKYEQTGDPKALDDTTRFLEQAYQMIPDGGSFDIYLDAESKKLEVSRIGPDGEEEEIEVTPEMLPALVQGTMNGSLYWKQIMKLGDPKGYQAELTDRNARAREGRAEGRTLEREGRAETRTLAKEDRAERRVQQKEMRASQESDRKARFSSDLTLERQKKLNPDMDWSKINPLLQTYQEAVDAEDEQKMNEAASRIWDALPPRRDRAEMMTSLGLEPPAAGGWKYTGPAEAPPAGYPNAKRAKDGAWYVPGENGKWKKLVAEGG